MSTAVQWQCSELAFTRSSNFAQDNGYLKNSVMILSASRQMSCARHKWNLPNPPHFVIHQSSYPSVLNSLRCRLCLKINHKEKLAITIQQMRELWNDMNISKTCCTSQQIVWTATIYALLYRSEISKIFNHTSTTNLYQNFSAFQKTWQMGNVWSCVKTVEYSTPWWMMHGQQNVKFNTLATRNLVL